MYYLRSPAVESIVLLAELTEEPITLIEHEAIVAHPAAGAVVGFVGAVRNHDGGRSVKRLEYSTHPIAARVISEIAEEVVAGSDGVCALAVSHRVGLLEIGDIAMVAAVSADHRATAFAACGLLVETVKARLPVWKHQVFADGSDEWVGSA